jgi:hypothetical protein
LVHSSELYHRYILGVRSLELALNVHSSTRPVAVDCPPEERCILSSILPPPSRCPNKRDRGGKKSPLQGGKGPSLANLPKKEPVYVAKACAVLSVGQSVLSGYISVLARTEVLFLAGTARRCRVRLHPPFKMYVACANSLQPWYVGSRTSHTRNRS